MFVATLQAIPLWETEEQSAAYAPESMRRVGSERERLSVAVILLGH